MYLHRILLTVGVAFGGFVATASAALNTATSSKPERIESSGLQGATLLRTPLHFEPNAGQFSPEVKLAARGPGYQLFLTPSEMVLALGAAQPEATKTGQQTIPLESQTAVLRMRLVNANPTPIITPMVPLPSRVNYLVGNDPSRWHRNLATYARARYAEVYRGIDLVFYGNQRELEFDFVVSPGADPGAIRLAFDGADRMTMEANGDLVLTVGEGTVRHRKPVIYQMADGQRREVAGRFVPGTVAGAPAVGFEIGAYDPSLPLVIDPVLVYSTFLGGSGNDLGNDIAVDRAGNICVAGFTRSANFPQHNALPIPFVNPIAFVAKFTPDGGTLLFSTYLGGNGDDNIGGLALDASDNLVLVGTTQSTDFPAVNAAQPVSGGGYSDVFVTKLSPDGATILFSTHLGGSWADTADGKTIAVNATGDIFVAGITASPDFPVTNALQSARSGSGDGFVARYTSTGSRLYATYLGGSGGRDEPHGVAADNAGNAYVVGMTDSGDFPVTAGAVDTSYGGSWDAFVAKLGPAGTNLVYATYLGGDRTDMAYDIAVDPTLHAYVTGLGSAGFPTTPGAFQSTNAGFTDAFVLKLNPTATALVYGTFLGGSDVEEGRGIAVNAAGEAHVAGLTRSANFPRVRSIQAFGGGTVDVFATKLAADGSALIYSTHIGGNQWDQGHAVTLDADGHAYVTGSTRGGTFPTAAPYDSTFNGSTEDAFVFKLADIPTTDLAVTMLISPVPVRTGGTLTYTLTVTNRSLDTATGVGLTNTLPVSVTFVTATVSQGSWSLAGNVVTCDIGNLAAGSIAVVTLTVTAPETAGLLYNVVRVGAVETDTQPSNNLASQITQCGIYDLVITKLANPSTLVAGQELTYSLIVSNSGPDTAPWSEVTDYLGSDQTFFFSDPGLLWLGAEVSQGQYWTDDYDPVLRLTWRPGALAAGATATAQIRLMPLIAQGLTNRATVTATPADSSSGNNASVATNLVVPGPGVLEFVQTRIETRENAGAVPVQVRRLGGSAGTVSVQFSATAGTATAGADFVATNGTLAFADGQTLQSFQVVLIDDSSPECNETILLALNAPTGGAGLSPNSAAVLVVIEDDLPPAPPVEAASRAPAPIRFAAGELFDASEEARITPDGRFIVYQSEAPNLTQPDSKEDDSDIFRYDRQTGVTTLVSVSQLGSDTGNDDSETPSISDNGRFVAFESDASDLVANDTNDDEDVFVRDVLTGDTHLVSVNHAGTDSGDRFSNTPTISANGRFVVFFSYASNLTGITDTNQSRDVFLRDLESNTTHLVSLNLSGVAAGGVSGDPFLSADGRYVAFTCGATNILAGDTNGVDDVFLFDRLTSSRTLLSVATNRGWADRASTARAISADGRYVAFTSLARNIVTNDGDSYTDVYLRDTQSNITSLVSHRSGTSGNHNSYFEAMSPDGRFVVFSSRASNLNINDSNSADDVFLYDRASDSVTTVSVNTGGIGTGDKGSYEADVSADGRHVVFKSQASNLVTPAVPTTYFQVYLRDVQAGVTRLLSATPSGTAGDRTSDEARISDNGEVAVFASYSSDLGFLDRNEDEDVFAVNLASNILELVSGVVSDTADGESDMPRLSSNGRYLVFASSASTLVSIPDTNRTDDLFVRDLQTGDIALVSVNHAGTGSGNDRSYDPVISADARWIAFSSSASNLVALDANGRDDVFARDRIGGVTLLVSANTNGLPGNATANYANISADGRLVAFSSTASDLVPGDSGGFWDVFVRDLVTGATRLVSVNATGLNPGNGNSQGPVLISPNGRFVFFSSDASDLVVGDANGKTDRFVRDLLRGQTIRIAPLAREGMFSADSRHFAFTSSDVLVSGDGNGEDDVFVLDLLTGELRTVSVNPGGACGDNWSGSPSLSANGRFVAFFSLATDLTPENSGGVGQIYIRDLWQQTTRLVSVNCVGTQGGDEWSRTPAVSADGRFVAFETEARDLTPGTVMADADNIILRDLLASETRLVSRNVGGTGGGNGESEYPKLSADGRVVAFESEAWDLVANDRNFAADVFAVRYATGSPTADLAVGLASVPGSVAVGTPFNVICTVTNSGPAIATGVTITLGTPSGSSIQSVTASAGTNGVIQGTVVAHLGTLPGVGVGTLTVQLTAAAPGELTCQASAFGNEPDLHLVNNHAWAATTVSGDSTSPELWIGPVSGNQLEIAWPGQPGDFALYETDSLSPPIDWQPSTNQVEVSNNRCRVTIAPGTGNQFFRLHKP
jgi:uncharacterized repeat protein (TIGR01451 family)